MARRKSNPAVLVALLIALAVSFWMRRDDAPAITTVPAEQTASAPAHAPEAAAPEQQQNQVRAEDPLASHIANESERAEVQKTLELIERGGPFPHKQDGTVFGNRERRLPQQPRGYYREYTVRTPGAPNRGARRIVRGDGGEFFYTRDHYRTFTRIN
ncbi:MAG TPA: ribonuclease domain-containing protein [Thermoanaerobaculia bacterium]|nr:ribonuclease domain-containing protein [Thermoanaerobaculia bacterium]